MIEITCIVCGSKKQLPPSKPQKYCSKTCNGIGSTIKRSMPRPQVDEFSGRTKLINGKFIVNEEYYDWLMQWRWHISSTGYVVNRNMMDGKKVTVRMHRLIMQPPDDMVIDHINRNPLDNRVSNLRVCTQRENMTNLKSVDNAKGYYFDNSRQRWAVDSRTLGVRTLFMDSEQEAIDYVAALKAQKRQKQLMLEEN